ncbi:MAG: hypothetical protein IPO32_19730 [Crocinitomicaceae bacterium]|nr:hypothetical protein [Crocinitomicaceae bacterium]
MGGVRKNAVSEFSFISGVQGFGDLSFDQSRQGHHVVQHEYSEMEIQICRIDICCLFLATTYNWQSRMMHWPNIFYIREMGVILVGNHFMSYAY